MTSRALRIGVLLGDKLVEETLFRVATAQRWPITLGQSLRCSLSIPADGIPHKHALFTHDHGQLRLHVPATMTGTIIHGDLVTTTLADTMQIAQGARGRLILGDAVILFQELSAPFVPRLKLPLAIRGTLGDRVDRRLTAILATSLVAHMGIAGYAHMTDIEEPVMSGAMQETTYRQDSYDISMPELDPSEHTKGATAPAIAAPVHPTQVAAPVVRRVPGPGTTPGRGPEMSVAEAQRFASVLTGSEVGPQGMTTMRDRAPGAELGTQLAAVGDRPISIGNAETGFRQQPDLRLGTHMGPHLNDPTQLDRPQPKQEVRPGRIQIRPSPGTPSSSTLTVTMILDKISTVYMAGLQRCYKQGLTADASLQGKLALTFTISERGGVSAHTAQGVSATVDGCVSGLMANWRFPTPRDRDGDPTDQDVGLSLQLTPH
jgi:hypothetical protein